MAKILIVEDDPTLLEMVAYNLKKENQEVLTASDGGEALQIARDGKPDLIILDIMLPTMSGLEVCRIIRKESSVPILMLTAKTDETDKVVGLELGADDYVTKPFSMRELLARVRAMLRRSQVAEMPASDEKQIKVGDVEIDISRHQASLKGSVLELTPKEFDLLAFLARNRGLVFSREKLLETVWGYDYVGGTRTVDVHVRWLRQKIETNPSKPKHIVTVRGAGYKLVD